MAVLKIVTFPNKILREKSEQFLFRSASAKKPCRNDGDAPPDIPDLCSYCEMVKVADDMLQTLWQTDNGIALAANQVGLKHRVFVINTRYGNGPLPPVIVNPSFTPIGSETSDQEEGCLSFPGYRKVVRRPSKVLATYQDTTGDDFTVELDGLWARVFQHETDHLDGTLFLDDLPKVEREKVAMQIVRRKK